MLTSLHIENVAVIKRLDADFSEGFTVFTGETGAGKSVIIDSINLLLGAKPQRELIRTGENTAIVSGFFTDLSKEQTERLSELGISPDDDGSLMIQRTVSADSRSVFRISGRAVSSALARDVGRALVNIHGQHDSADIRDPEKHIVYLDSYAGIADELALYRSVYREMCEAERELEKYKKAEREGVRKAELLEYQINDIESAALKDGEEEELVAEKKVLQNSKHIAKQVSTVYRALYKNKSGASASQLIELARKALDDISDIFPDTEKLSERLFDYQAEIESIAQTVASMMPGSIQDSETRLAEIDDRLDVIHRMKRKYGATVRDVLDCYAQFVSELEGIRSSSEMIEKYTVKLDALTKRAEELAGDISGKRHKAGRDLSEDICKTLAYLDMEKVSFSVSILKKRKNDLSCAFDVNGFDEVEFYISTNVGEPLKPLLSVASGGELSRIMLAIKCALASTRTVSTLIFDEIDTGVSGKTSQKIGIKLRELSRNAQVLCITHSAQIAAIGNSHYLIKKTEIDERAHSTLVLLQGEDRVEEIARIMGGVNVTEKTVETAREMIALAENI